MGSAPGGGGLSTYRELAALATDMGQPELIYRWGLSKGVCRWGLSKGVYVWGALRGEPPAARADPQVGLFGGGRHEST